MSLKAIVKQHFSHDHISRHWNMHFSDINEIELTEIENLNETILMKKFNTNDIEKCSELYLRVFSDYPWYDDWLSLNQVQNYLKELTDNPVFEGFVAYENSEVVAVCLGHSRTWWTGKELFIDEFFVRNERQGNGLGTKLLKYVKEYLKNENYERLILLTNKGIPAHEFYMKNGFNNNEQRTVMVKEI